MSTLTSVTHKWKQFGTSGTLSRAGQLSRSEKGPRSQEHSQDNTGVWAHSVFEWASHNQDLIQHWSQNGCKVSVTINKKQYITVSLTFKDTTCYSFRTNWSVIIRNIWPCFIFTWGSVKWGCLLSSLTSVQCYLLCGTENCLNYQWVHSTETHSSLKCW